jgi:Tfp pilus assembly pilus retraction ATPase PilT
MIYTLSALLEIMLVERADGLHLHPGEKPVVEVARNLFRVSGPRMEAQEIEALLRQIASKEEYREFLSSQVVSSRHHVPGKAWFNVMAFREQGQTRLEIRAVR